MSTRKESAKEENLNVLTHAFGLLLSIVGLYFLLQKSIQNPDKFFYLCINLRSIINIYVFMFNFISLLL